MNLEFAPIATVAGKEFWDRIRSLWVLAIAVLFTVFALAIAYFGGAQQGAIGFRSIEFTIASLVSLVIYLIPLIALLLGFDAIVGERERGSLDLLLSMPITRLELLLGKFLGLAAALAFSTVAGFGLVAMVLAGREKQEIAGFEFPFLTGERARSFARDAGDQDVLRGAVRTLDVMSASRYKGTDVGDAEIAGDRLA